MSKLCFSCFKKIPLLAGKCPYCLDQHQGVYGRIIIGLLIIVGLIFAANYTKPSEPKQDTSTIEEVLKELKK